MKWRSVHVIYWSKKNPCGMRFNGGGAGSDATPVDLYDNRDHLCLFMYRQFKMEDKEHIGEEVCLGTQPYVRIFAALFPHWRGLTDLPCPRHSIARPDATSSSSNNNVKRRDHGVSMPTI